MLVLLTIVGPLNAAAQLPELDSLKQGTQAATGTQLTELYLEIAEQYLESDSDSSKRYTDLAYHRSWQEDDSVQAVYTARALRLQAILAWNAYNYDSAFRIMEQAVRQALASEDSIYIAVMYRQYGTFYARKQDAPKALDLCKTALRYCPVYDTANYIHLLSTVGTLYHRLGLYDKALQSYLSVFSEFDEEQLGIVRLSYLYAYLGATYNALKNYEKALECKHKALRMAKQNGNMMLQPSLLNNITNVYTEIRNYPQAEEYGLAAYQLSDSLQDTTSLASASINLGRLYTHTKAYTVAKRYLEQGRALTLAQGDRYTFVSGNFYLAQLYINIGKLSQADTALEHALHVEKFVPDGGLSGGSYPTLAQLVEIYQSKVTLDSLQEEFEEAFISQHWHMFYRDSLLSEEKQKTILQTEIRFESLEKDNEITLLKTENDLQTIKETQMIQQRAGLIAGSILLLGLLGVTFNRYRLKQRALGIIQIQKQAIEEKNAENELLIREIHHRVKNNLQIILSLLHTQAHVLRDPQAVAVITESQNRVKSMALIHEKLYQANNFTKVPVQPYLSEMAHNIARAYRQPVQLQLDIDPTEISMSTAVPLGLIVTELLTNAFKYAFEEGQPAHLSITFRQESLNDSLDYCLQIADNGKGLPPDFDIEHSRSFGLKLVKGLIRQLNGNLSVTPNPGTQFSIQFKEQPTQ